MNNVDLLWSLLNNPSPKLEKFLREKTDYYDEEVVLNGEDEFMSLEEELERKIIDEQTYDAQTVYRKMIEEGTI